MKLYTFPPSPNSLKVMAVIHQLEIDVEIVVVDLTKGESKTPEFMVINPNGKIPTLQDGELVIWESQAIMLYLAEKFDSPLIPKDVGKRAEMHQWLSWHIAHFGDAVSGVAWERLAPHFFEGYQADQVALEKSLENLAVYAPILDQRIAKQDFVLGEKPSLADIALAAPLIHKNMAELPLEDYPNILAWYDRVASLPYFASAIPQPPVEV